MRIRSFIISFDKLHIIYDWKNRGKRRKLYDYTWLGPLKEEDAVFFSKNSYQILFHYEDIFENKKK